MRHFVVLLFICNFLYPCSSFLPSFLADIFSPKQRCWSWQFGCDNGCIPREKKCNGVQDCNDKSDEKNCVKKKIDDYDDYYEHEYNDDNELYYITCGEDEYKCENDECIPKAKFCDVTEDCSDGSDEHDGCVDNLDCSDRFRCKDRHCVFKEWVCDGTTDCPDGSDESDCSLLQTNKNVSTCTIQNFQYLCKNQRCIPLDAVCNKKNDCGDGSDEGANCTLSCSIKCNHECKQTPEGNVCVCKPGYKLQNDNRTCADIDECQIYGTCDQGCSNSLGSYNCTCQINYFLLEDHKTCKAKDGDATLAFSTKTKIMGMYLGTNLHSKLHFELASNLNHAVGVAMNGNYVYWSDIEENRTTIVKSINKVKNQHEAIVTTGLSEITSIAVDWVTENIYFTDEGHHHIGVCTNNGTYCTVLVTEIEKPTGIVLLPTHGKMYWCDWSFLPHIGMAGMDGKNLNIIVYSNVWPKSLTIDYPNDRLYWIDAKSKTIESVRLDGTDRKSILHDIIRDPFSVAVFENKLYWSDLDSHTIESCNKFTGKDWQILFQTKQHEPYSVHIDHSAIKPKIDNPCSSNPCSELCLLNAHNAYTCACTLDKTLNPDMRTCRNSITHLMVIDTSEDIFINYYYKMLGKLKITHASKSLRHIRQIMSDPTSGQIIMSEGYSKKNILRYEPHTNIFESVITINNYFLEELAFDHIGNNIYGINTEENSIDVYSIKTNAMTAFYVTRHQLEYITLAPEENIMYVVTREGIWSSIYKMQMNGLGKPEIIKDGIPDNSKMLMCYDSDSQTLFVNILYDGVIWMYSAKGSRILRTGLKPLVSLTVANNNIFWVQYDSTVLYWTNFTSPSNHKDVAFHIPVKRSLKTLLVTLRNDTRQNHVCRRNNGNCSHVCLISNITSFICACPPKMELSNDNRTCVEHRECLNHEYKCSEHKLCIQKEKLCDGTKDCPNGEDEGRKHCEKKGKCLDNEFKCKNGQCIKSTDRCNRRFDCGDQSDEENCEIKNCKSDEFRCDDGTCISNTKICDGKYDCYDFSDEKFSACKSHTCDSKEFMCNSGKCIPATFVCDNDLDCNDGEDEAPEKCKTKHRECKQGDFVCHNGNCISPSLKCDGNNDCQDGSDERYCLKLNHLVNCTANEYRCLNSSICLEETRRCNGVPDCPRHDDEHNCSFCSNTDFTCNNKKCIPERWVCDAINDCGDNSDENNCQREYTEKNIKIKNLKCDEFKCTNNSTCLSYDQVCDGFQHCQDNSDENGNCQTACELNNICKGVCHKTPNGGVCGCQDGYRLAADGISCEDINECESEYNCSQICHNTEGSYKCLCYDGFVIHDDKVTCKSMSPSMEFITATDNDIRKISSDLRSIKIIYSLSGLGASGLDVNILQGSVYWSNDEFGRIKKFNLNSRKLITLSTVEHPRALAVDWITDNVYVNNNGQPNTIKVCNLDAQRCAPVVEIENKAKVGPLVVDSINRWLFWAEISWQMDLPFNKICRTDMTGADMNIIVSDVGLVNGMSIDLLNSKLYWSDSFYRLIESSNFDGSERRPFLSTDMYHPLDISIYEQSLYWLVGANGRVKVCKLRTKLCDRAYDLGPNSVHKLFTIFHASRQPVAENPCNKVDCDYMCVLKNDNATCICSDGELIQFNTTCTTNTNEPKNEPKTGLKFIRKPSKHNMSSTYSVTIIVLLVGVMLLCVYYFYQKNRLKLKPETDLSCSSIRFQNPSYDRRDEVEVTLDSLASNLSPGQHEYVNPIDNKYLSMKAMMENSESRQRSNQYSKERDRDREETEKQDSLIYLVHSK